MGKPRSRLAVLVWGLILLLLLVCPVKAQNGISIDSDLTNAVFPDGISFVLKIQGTAFIDQVQLTYWTNARSCLSSSARQDVNIQNGTVVTARWDWSHAGLPPGAEITWQWQIHDIAGRNLTTPEKHLMVEDNRYTWQKLQAGGIRVEWSDGDYAFGQLLLSTAVSSLARLAKEAGISQPNQALLVIYPSTSDLRDAAPELTDWAGGVAYPSFGTIMIGITPGETAWLAKVIPHELAHLVVDQRIDNCVGNRLPTWLSEGLAMFAEGPASAEDQKLVLTALGNGTIQPLLGLTAEFPANSARANLAYTQSGMVVAFLVQQYGAENIDKMLAGVQQGKTIDAVLREVYGLDTAGIDQAWRASLGFGSPPAAATTGPTAAAKHTAVPTFALYATAVPSASPTLTASNTVIPTIPAVSPTPQPVPTHPVTPVPTNPAPAPAQAAGLPAWVWILAGVVVAAAAGIFWRISRH